MEKDDREYLSPRALWMAPVLLLILLGSIFPFWKPQDPSVLIRCSLVMLGEEIFLFTLLGPFLHSQKGKIDGLFLLAVTLSIPTLTLYTFPPLSSHKIIEVQIAFLAFALALSGLSYLLQKAMASSYSQLIASLVGLGCIGVLFISNHFLTLFSSPEKAIYYLLRMNPLPTAIYELTQWDFFRLSLLYEASNVSDYPYAYPEGKNLAKIYFSISALFYLAGGILHCLSPYLKKSDGREPSPDEE